MASVEALLRFTDVCDGWSGAARLWWHGHAGVCTRVWLLAIVLMLAPP